MKIFFKKNKIFFISLSFLIVFGFFLFNDHKIPAEAGSYDASTREGHNVSGFAYSENIGWISFNSTSDGSSHNYGVYVNTATGDLSGFAWSENVGWISFNRNTSYCAGGVNIGKACSAAGDCPGSSCGGNSDGATGNPPANPYQTGSGAIAKYNSSNHEFSGWAKILSMGNDGWISLSGTSPDYGIVFNPASKELSGWAWNGNNNGSGIGWISFNADNCNNDGATYDGTPSGCPSNGTDFHDYKIMAELNQKPSVDNLVAPEWNDNQACDNDEALRANLSWEVHDQDVGDKVSAYQLILKDASDDSEVLNTGKCNCSPTDDGCDSKCTINLNIDFSNGGTMTYTVFSSYLDYNTNYKWEVRIWDDFDEASDWEIYNSNSGSDTDGDSDNNSLTFTTYKHEFPQPYFTWSPAQPAIDEEVLFISRDLSKYATDLHTSADLNCTEPPCAYEWTDDCDGGCDISSPQSPNASSTIVTFKTGLVGKKIRLTVKDSDYACSTSTTFNIKQKLPQWIEAR